MLDLAYLAVLGVFTLVVTTVTMLIIMKKIIYPGMTALFAEKYETAEGAIKRGFSALGTKSAQVKKEQKFEGEMVDELLASYPEIEAVASQISPRLVELIEEDPVTALRVAERYLPTLKRLFPDFFAQFGTGQQELTEFEF